VNLNRPGNFLSLRTLMCDRSTSRRNFFPPLEGYPTQNTLAKLTDVRIGYAYQASDGTLATAHKLQDFRNQEMSSPTAWMGREMLGDRVVGKLDCGSGKTARAVVDDCPSASSLPAASLPPAISKLHCHSLLGTLQLDLHISTRTVRNKPWGWRSGAAGPPTCSSRDLDLCEMRQTQRKRSIIVQRKLVR